MREFKEKRIYITMEISLSNKNAIEKRINATYIESACPQQAEFNITVGSIKTIP